MKLSNLQVALVVCNVMGRILSNYSWQEQPSSLKVLNARIRKFMISRAKSNQKEFMEAMLIERAVWKKTTESFDAKTPLFVVDLVCKLYSYYSEPLNKYAKISDKIIDRVSLIQNVSISTDVQLEFNDDDIMDKFSELFEPFSGIKRKSAFSGKKSLVKNNMILEGKKIAEGF